MDGGLIINTESQLPDLTEIPGKIRRLSKESRKTYEYAMNSFRDYCQKHEKTQNFDSMLDWIESFSSAATKMAYLHAIKAVLREIYRFDPRLSHIMNSLNEIKPAKMDQGVTESKYLKKPEVERLIAGSPDRLGLIIEALFWTGSRISGLLDIEIRNCIDMGRVREIRVIGKGNKENVMYMTNDLFDRIRAEFAGETYLFEHDGQQYCREYVSRWISEYGKKVLRKRVSAHTLRHSLACFLRDDRKLSVDLIQRALNHSSPTTTIQKYLHGRPTAEQIGMILPE
jgi:site-specific recombinase XerD